jgi:gamma-glutamylcyclotransferase (GGCT)/AIG2-like uncharacterized protein YtfP
MPLVFAYGSNMQRAAMAQRCPASRPLGPARLMRHRFVVLPQGYASVVPDVRGTIHGVLWDASLADMRSLDRYENVAAGLYRKTIHPVLKAGGGTARAILYVGHGEGGRPQPSYMEAVIAAARDWALPESYIRELESFLSRSVAAAGPFSALPRKTG